MASFRFEYYENMVTKYHLRNLNWTQIARYAFTHDLNKSNVTVQSIRMIDEDTIEIVKRKDKRQSLLYKLGCDQFNVGERIIINRKEQSTAIDRLDLNFWTQEQGPHLGRRDLFYPETKYENKNLTAYVRHDFWIHKLMKIDYILLSWLSAWSYKRGIKKSHA